LSRNVETLYKILQRLGEADIESIIYEAYKAGIPPPVATRLLMRLVEKRRVEIVCNLSVKYRPV